MQMPVALELVQNKHPLLINVPASLLLQDGTDADLRLRLFIISSRELLHTNPSQSDVGWLAHKTSRGGGHSCSWSNGEGTRVVVGAGSVCCSMTRFAACYCCCSTATSISSGRSRLV